LQSVLIVAGTSLTLEIWVDSKSIKPALDAALFAGDRAQHPEWIQKSVTQYLGD
jgi:hypothetical protein